MHLKEITSQGYYIYEAPVRLWHWITALSIVVLAVTGYFIGRPLPSIQGEATFMATEREIIMCIGVPVQVISPGQWFAKCRDRHGELIDVDIRLVACGSPLSRRMAADIWRRSATRNGRSGSR